jgi:hypothetical protein
MGENQMTDELEEEYVESTTEKINRNRIIEKGEAQAKIKIEDEFALSSELLKDETLPQFKDYELPTNKDFIKANYNPAELSATRINAIQSVSLAFYGNLLGMDLSPTQLTHVHYNAILANTSRGKGGWAGYLSKTSKSVSETTLVEKANEIQGQNQKKGIIGKFLGR